MHLLSLPCHQVLADRVGHQRVSEPHLVSVDSRSDQSLRVQLAQTGERVTARDLGQLLGRHRPVGDAEGPGHDPAPHWIAQPAGQEVGQQVRQWPVVGMERELLGEERLAEAAREHPGGVVRLGVMTTQERELLGCLGKGQRDEGQGRHVGKTADTREPVGEPLVHVGVIGAHRHDQGAGVTAQQLQDVEGGGVRPVRILDHEGE